jgi:hypothetical protein
MNKNKSLEILSRIAIIAPQIIWVLLKMVIVMICVVICGLVAIAQEDIRRL